MEPPKTGYSFSVDTRISLYFEMFNFAFLISKDYTRLFIVFFIIFFLFAGR